MTLGPLFLTIVTVYLVLIAYGVVGARRRLRGGSLIVTQLLLVLLPVVLLVGALIAAGEGALVAQWARLLLAMPIAGGIVAVAAERIARRIEP